MVASDALSDRTSEHIGKDDSKMMLTKVRYINKKESVMCFCHVDDEELDHETPPSSSEGGSESDIEVSNHSDFTDVKMGSPCNGKLSKRKEDKLKRKSVRFLFNDSNFDASSTVSEPVKSVNITDDNVSNSFLPPISDQTNTPRKITRDDSHIKESREPEKWADKRHTGVPDRMVKTLYSLSLSPRVKRKMSVETLTDIKKAIAKSRESIKKASISHKQSQHIHQRGLQSIPEAGLARTYRRVLPRRLVPVESPLVKSPLSMMSESDAEQERLDFIKRALSPMSDGVAVDAFRNRAATISGGEKRSWLIQRRNSRENVWSKNGQNSETTELINIDLTRL